MASLEMKLEPLCEVVAYVTPPIPVGPSTWGIRLVAPLVLGTVKGPKICGTFSLVGGAWALIRPDLGAGEVGLSLSPIGGDSHATRKQQRRPYPLSNRRE